MEGVGRSWKELEVSTLGGAGLQGEKGRSGLGTGGVPCEWMDFFVTLSTYTESPQLPFFDQIIGHWWVKWLEKSGYLGFQVRGGGR